MLRWMQWVLKRILHLKQTEKSERKTIENYSNSEFYLLDHEFQNIKIQFFRSKSKKNQTFSILKHVLGFQNHAGTLQQKLDCFAKTWLLCIAWVAISCPDHEGKVCQMYQGFAGSVLAYHNVNNYCQSKNCNT